MSGDRGLMPTMGTLIGVSRLDQIRPIMTAPRAAETIRPFPSDHVSQTIALGSELPSELSQGHWFIHRLPPLYKNLVQQSYNGLSHNINKLIYFFAGLDG